MEFLGFKIKLGHRIFEGLDFKWINEYGIIILIDENKFIRIMEFSGLKIKLGHEIFEGLDFK